MWQEIQNTEVANGSDQPDDLARNSNVIRYLQCLLSLSSPPCTIKWTETQKTAAKWTSDDLKKKNVAGDPRHGGQQRRIWSARNHKELKGRLASECLQWKACEELADLKCYPEQTRAWAALCSRGYTVLTVGRGELAFLGLGELSGPR